MSLQGLPDFQRPLHGHKYQIYYPFENRGPFVVASAALEIAATQSGLPDFRLEMVRGVSPMMAPKPYSVLEFRVVPAHPAADALELIRLQHPRATIAGPLFQRGFLRFQVAADTADVPPELLKPLPVSTNGIGESRVVMRMGPSAGAVIEGALKGEVLGLLAWAEMEMLGVAPRLPVTVTFDPSKLLGALGHLAGDPAVPILTRDQLEEFFQQDLSRLPVSVGGEIDRTMRREFSEAMADLVRVRYGDLVPSLATPAFSIALRTAEAASGQVSWDLSIPTAAPRAIIASLDPFDAARQVLQSAPLDTFVKTTVVPPLGGGTRRVHISANLPSARVGIVSLGVDISVPPRPPGRRHSIEETVEFTAPEDSAIATLKLAVGEALSYDYTAWVVRELDGAAQRIDHVSKRNDTETLDLNIGEFPVRFVTIGASSSLLAVATVKGVCRGEELAKKFEIPFELSHASPTIGVAVAHEAVVTGVEIIASEIDGSKTLPLVVDPEHAAMLDLTSFAEFGPQRVAIECDFEGASSGVFSIDLVPEGSQDRAEAIQTMFFTPAVPRKEWTYLASSPFRGGYRYRLHAAAASETHPWSAVQSPTEPLRLRMHQGRAIPAEQKHTSTSLQ